MAKDNFCTGLDDNVEILRDIWTDKQLDDLNKSDTTFARKLWDKQSLRIDRSAHENNVNVSAGAFSPFGATTETAKRTVRVTWDSYCETLEMQGCASGLCEGIDEKPPLHITPRCEVLEVPECDSIGFSACRYDYACEINVDTLSQHLEQSMFQAVITFDKKIAREYLQYMDSTAGENVYLDANGNIPLNGFEQDGNKVLVDRSLLNADLGLCLSDLMAGNNYKNYCTFDSTHLRKEYRQAAVNAGIDTVEGRDKARMDMYIKDYESSLFELKDAGLEGCMYMVEQGSIALLNYNCYRNNNFQKLDIPGRDVYVRQYESITFPGFYYDLIYEKTCKDTPAGKTTMAEKWELRGYWGFTKNPSACDKNKTGIIKVCPDCIGVEKYEPETTDPCATDNANPCDGVELDWLKECLPSGGQLTIPANSVGATDKNGDALNILSITAVATEGLMQPKLVAELTDSELAADATLGFSKTGGTASVTFTAIVEVPNGEGVIECECKICKVVNIPSCLVEPPALVAEEK